MCTIEGGMLFLIKKIGYPPSSKKPYFFFKSVKPHYVLLHWMAFLFQLLHLTLFFKSSYKFMSFSYKGVKLIVGGSFKTDPQATKPATSTLYVQSNTLALPLTFRPPRIHSKHFLHYSLLQDWTPVVSHCSVVVPALMAAASCCQRGVWHPEVVSGDVWCNDCHLLLGLDWP